MGRDASTRKFYYLSGITPVRAQRCPPVMGWSGGRSASPMCVRDHPRRGIETPEIHMPAPCHPRTVGELPNRAPAPPSTPLAQLLLDTLTPPAVEVALTVQIELQNPRRQSRPAAPPAR